METPAPAATLTFASVGDVCKKSAVCRLPERERASTWFAQPAGTVSLEPNQKLLHFIRHAQGFHNVDARPIQQRAADARLTPEGEAQCAALAATVEAAGLRPELIASSPLTRTLQTGVMCFRGPDGCPPMAACESLRETVNFLCDRRRPLSEIRPEFEQVDFSACPHDEDAIWAAYEARHGPADLYGEHREHRDLPSLARRAREAIEWLGGRPEREIVVVSHQSFLRALFSLGLTRKLRGLPVAVEYGGPRAAELKEVMMQPFANCEMRTVLATFPRARQP